MPMVGIGCSLHECGRRRRSRNPARSGCYVTMVAHIPTSCYKDGMHTGPRWVLLIYRLPREPSTPRIALWRRLRQLGAVQLLDGLVGLPLTDHTREQLEWLAEGIIEAAGEATVWLAEPASKAHGVAL